MVAERGLLQRKKEEDLVVHRVPLCLGFIMDDCGELISDRPNLPLQPRRVHSLIELRQGLVGFEDHPLITAPVASSSPSA